MMTTTFVPHGIATSGIVAILWMALDSQPS